MGFVTTNSFIFMVASLTSFSVIGAIHAKGPDAEIVAENPFAPAQRFALEAKNLANGGEGFSFKDIVTGRGVSGGGIPGP